MAYTCPEALAKIRGYYGWSDTYQEWGVTNNQQALAHWNLFEDHEALGHLISANSQTNAAVSMLIGNFDDFWPDYAIAWWMENCAGGANMDDILTAMLSATHEELTKFMGITQAYKVAVWDTPFNEEFYAALARGFKTWGVG